MNDKTNTKPELLSEEALDQVTGGAHLIQSSDALKQKTQEILQKPLEQALQNAQEDSEAPLESIRNLNSIL